MKYREPATNIKGKNVYGPLEGLTLWKDTISVPD